jgi:succinate-semialdehyde dehydrogenase/glutarate-semialdehyde dehydrogenase
MTEVATSLDLARFYLRLAPDLLAPRRLTSATLALWRKRITIAQEPHGVVAVISPWNYPFMLPAGVVVPALLAGNAVILKPSELTPSCGALLAALLHAAGVPTDVLQVLQGDGAVGAALVQSDIDKVFYRSVATGRKVGHACAERFIPCALELGGSDPAIVCDDADVEHAASGITWGRFSNGGQTCVAPKRVYVAATVYDRFVAAMQQRVQSLQLKGAGTASFDVGPLIQPSQSTTLAAQGDDATARGARACVRRDARGVFHRRCCSTSARRTSLCGETFGPLLHRVRDDRRCAGEPFRLSERLESQPRAHAIAARYRPTVVINDVTLVAGLRRCHGSMKAVARGAHGRWGSRSVRTRTVVDDLFTSWRQAWWLGTAPIRRRGGTRMCGSRWAVDPGAAVGGVEDASALSPERPIGLTRPASRA